MSDCRRLLVSAVFMTAALSAGIALAQAPAPKPGAAPAPKPGVTPAEQAQFQQKNAEAQMQELQARMFRLSELIKDTEPGDASRLLLAVRKAREELIIEQMKEVLELIDRRDLARAAEGEKQIIAKLEELKKLLLAAENDLVLQLEKLRKIESALQKLDAAIKEQKRQEGQTGAMAQQQQQNKPVEPSKFTGARQEQQKNRQATDAITQLLKPLGATGAKAGASLGAATQSMSGAEASLSGSKAGEAQPKQGDALKKLEQAKEELEREKAKLLAEIEKQVKAQVLENLQQMLDRQKLIRESTQRLGERLASADREAGVQARRLATAEQHVINIADQTVALIEQTQFSVALPPAIRSVQRRCAYVMADLSAGRGDARVVDAEKQVEADLQALIDTMKEFAPRGTPGQSNCKGCGGSKNKLLAELRVLRLLQLRVNEETKDADGRRAAALASAELPADVKGKIGTVRDNQEQVRAATDRIHKSVCPECLKGEH
jgi:hypothetical protein